jgi:hypothetical protein
MSLTGKLQVHLAKQITIETPADPKIEGSTPTTTTIPLVGMSGRCVRYLAPLPNDKHQKAELDAAKLAGPTASGGEIRELCIQAWLRVMVLEVSEPTDNPAGLTPAQWHRCSPGELATTGDPWSWGQLFTPKDTAFLQQEYQRYNEMSMMLVNLLSGKAVALTED